MNDLETLLRQAVEGLDVVTPTDLVSRSVKSAGRRRKRRRAVFGMTVLAGGAGAFAMAVTMRSSEAPPATQVLIEATTPPPMTATRTPTAALDCPPFVAPGRGGYASVDYVDFLQAHGRQYIAGLGPPARVTPSDLGAQDLIVGCSYSAVNDATGHVPQGPIRDGDAAYLTPGTPVFAIKGWSPTCRLAARLKGELHVYLAYLPHTAVAKPDPCALR